VATVQEIYVNGKNKFIEESSDLQSLSSLSVQADQLMRDEPLYNLNAYGMKEIPTIIDNANNHFSYGDIIINDVFNELEAMLGDE